MRKPLFALIVLLMASTVLVSRAYSVTTILFVDPSSILDATKVAGTMFTIDINVKNAVNLYTFDFRVNYSTTVLKIASTSLGSFYPMESMIWKNDTNDALGYVRFLVSLPVGTPKGEGLSGSGTLMTMNFTVKSSGSSRLDLCNVTLVDANYIPIVTKVYDGYFRNTEGAKLYVDPEYVIPRPEYVIDPALLPGKSFTINVNASDVTDLHASEFRLSYDPTLLDAVDISEGDFLKSAGSTNFMLDSDKALGDLWVNATLLSPMAGVNGGGSLAKITFNITAVGECILYLYDTKLIHSDLTTIEHAPGEGHFSNNPVVHDVAIINVATTVNTVKVENNVTIPLSKQISQIQAGNHLNVTVTAKNNGTVRETVNVTAYYDNTPIGTKNGIVLSLGASKTLNIDWNTEGVAAGNRTIWAEVTSVAGETNTANNKLVMEGKFIVLSSGLSIPIQYIVVAVVVVVAALVAVYLLKIRKPKTTGTQLQKP